MTTNRYTEGTEEVLGIKAEAGRFGFGDLFSVDGHVPQLSSTTRWT